MLLKNFRACYAHKNPSYTKSCIHHWFSPPQRKILYETLLIDELRMVLASIFDWYPVALYCLAYLITVHLNIPVL